MEIDEKNDIDRNKTEEEKRERKIKKYLNREFIRMNPDKEDYDEYNEFSRIQNYVNNYSKKIAEKSLIERISNRLLEMEFERYNSMVCRALKYFVKKVFPTI